MVEPTIRHSRAGDGAAYARLWVEFGRALAERMPAQFREPSLEGLAGHFERALAETQPGVLRVVAEIDGRAVGLAQAVIRRRSDSADPALHVDAAKTRIVLEDVVVEESMRGRGIGEALVRYVEEWGRANGAEIIMLNSDLDGPARRFYERLGFRLAAALYDKSL